jgi:hypothetical protein
MLGYRLNDQGFESQQGLGTFLFTTASRLTLGPTHPPIQWVAGALSLGLKWSGHEADHSSPSNAQVKNVWTYTSTPQYAFMAWCSVKAQGQLYLRCTLTYIHVFAKCVLCIPSWCSSLYIADTDLLLQS